MVNRSVLKYGSMNYAWQDLTNKAAGQPLGRVDLQLGNLGNIILAGNIHTIGFGDLEQRLNQRYRDNFYQYDVAANLQLGNLLPEKVGLKIPVYTQFSQTISTPQYDPYELDVKIKDKYQL